MGYPIKYAILELKENGGAKYNYEDIIKGYIVSKCYVLERRFSYSNKSISYVVSFPYDDFDNFVKWYKKNSKNYYFDIYKHYWEYRRNPSEELIRDDYIHHIVSNLFNTYEEAMNVSNYKNGCLRGKLLKNTGSNAYEYLKKEFEDTMDICSEYEKYIFANTTDMNVSINMLTCDSDIIQESLKEIVNKHEKNNTLVKKLNHK